MTSRIFGLRGRGPAAGGSAAFAQDVTLQLTEVITSPQRTETLQALVDEFEAANPGVTVEITSLPWGQAFEIFATSVSSGNTPDVVEMPDRWLALYAANGALESLEPWLAKWDADGVADAARARDGALRRRHRLHAPLRLLPAGDVLQQEAAGRGRHRQPAEHAGGVPRRRRGGLQARRQVRLLPARRARAG